MNCEGDSKPAQVGHTGCNVSFHLVHACSLAAAVEELQTLKYQNGKLNWEKTNVNGLNGF